MDCIFCKIAKGELTSTKVFEDDNLVAFNDIHPKAKVHILIVPKKHIESIKHIDSTHKDLLGQMFLTAQKIAKDKNLEGYKLVFNVGREGGQMVDHLHLHLLSPNVSNLPV